MFFYSIQLLLIFFNRSFFFSLLTSFLCIYLLSFFYVTFLNTFYIDILTILFLMLNILIFNVKYFNFIKSYNLINLNNQFNYWIREDLVCFKGSLELLYLFLIQEFYSFFNSKINLNYNLSNLFNLKPINYFYTFEKYFFLNKLTFLYTYYRRNENIWIDGFLFDFLQKKTADYWIRRFVISTGVLFIEFFLFDLLLKIYFNTLLRPLHYKSIFESFSTSEMLSIVIFLYHTFIIIMFSVLAILSF